MEYEYEGINQFEGCIAQSDTPIENWGYGTLISISRQPERLNERTYHRNEDGTYPPLEPVIGCDSLNTTHT